MKMKRINKYNWQRLNKKVSQLKLLHKLHKLRVLSKHPLTTNLNKTNHSPHNLPNPRHNQNQINRKPKKPSQRNRRLKNPNRRIKGKKNQQLICLLTVSTYASRLPCSKMVTGLGSVRERYLATTTGRQIKTYQYIIFNSVAHVEE